MSTPDLPLRMQQLKLHGMASQWPELLAKMRLHTMEPEHWMAELLQAESAERQVRAQANQMKAARFPVHRDLLGFDFAASPVDRALVERLHQGDFIHTPENVVLVGGPGTGKTHLATAIGIQAVRQHRLRVGGERVGIVRNRRRQLPGSAAAQPHEALLLARCEQARLGLGLEPAPAHVVAGEVERPLRLHVTIDLQPPGQRHHRRRSSL